MAEEGERPSRSRGFIVRMRITNRARSREKSLFVKCYKWVVWVSVSLYFLSSYFITHKPIDLAKTHLLLPNPRLASRALVESTTIDSSTTLHHKQRKIPKGHFNGLKIYIYDLPSKYNSDWLSDERCSTHLFASEVAIHRALAQNDAVRTLDPYEADFYFLPVYVSCNFTTSNGFPSLSHARSLLASAVAHVSGLYPFWNRSGGSDHVFVASHDYGACFHAMEDMAMFDGIPEFIKNSVVLQTFGVNHKHPCQDVENVVIPPYVSPEGIRKTLGKVPAKGGRNIWAFFRGKMEVNPKNVSGRFYSKGVRTAILKKFARDRRFRLKRHRFLGYQSEIARSVFCLCPLGWAPWSPRLVESVVLGCVPVVIADGIRLPFPEAVRWPEISLTVREKDVKKLGKILGHVAATNLSVIQGKLWDQRVRRALLYNVPMQEGDATWQVLEALSTKLDRSYRRSMASSE